MVIGTSYTPPVTLAMFRRQAIAAAVVGVAAIAGLVPAGLGGYALFGCVGLALGVLNSALVVQTVKNYTVTRPSKVRFAGSVLTRLAVMSVIAFACALLFRPEGIAVFAGLAVFQAIAVATSMLPLIKEIRQR